MKAQPTKYCHGCEYVAHCKAVSCYDPNCQANNPAASESGAAKLRAQARAHGRRRRQIPWTNDLFSGATIPAPNGYALDDPRTKIPTNGDPCSQSQ